MTHIVLIEKDTDFSKLGIKSSEKIKIIAEKGSMIPVSALPYISDHAKEIQFVDSYDETELAFICGKLSANDKVMIHTTNKHLAMVVNEEKAVKRARKTTAPAKKEQEKVAPVTDNAVKKQEKKTAFEENVNPPTEEKTPAPVKTPAKRGRKSSAVSSDIPKMTKKQVEDLLKKGKYDVKYADAVLTGIGSAMTRTSVGMMIRMELAKIGAEEKIVHGVPEYIEKNMP